MLMARQGELVFRLRGNSYCHSGLDALTRTYGMSSCKWCKRALTEGRRSRFARGLVRLPCDYYLYARADLATAEDLKAELEKINRDDQSQQDWNSSVDNHENQGRSYTKHENPERQGHSWVCFPKLGLVRGGFIKLFA